MFTGGFRNIQQDNVGTGDVVGPASSTDNAIARYDGTTGKLLQDSGATIDDSGNIAANNLSGTNTGDQDLSSLTTGAASSTDNALVRFDSTTGKIIQNGTITEDDSGNLSSVGTLNGNTIPTGPDTLVGKATTDTFTNKTMTATSNVLGGVTMTLGSDATGDIYYRNASGYLTRLAVGTNDQVLTLASGLPSWADAGGGGSASFNGLSGQCITVKGDLSSIEGEVETLTAFDSGTFANVQFSTSGRTSGTFTLTMKKNGSSIGTGTITSSTTASNGRYYGSITVSSSFANEDVISFEVSDTGVGSTDLVIAVK